MEDRSKAQRNSRKRNRSNGGEVILDKMMAESFPTLIKDISSAFQIKIQKQKRKTKGIHIQIYTFSVTAQHKRGHQKEKT